jgi:hypothetical protein
MRTPSLTCIIVALLSTACGGPGFASAGAELDAAADAVPAAPDPVQTRDSGVGADTFVPPTMMPDASSEDTGARADVALPPVQDSAPTGDTSPGTIHCSLPSPAPVAPSDGALLAQPFDFDIAMNVATLILAPEGSAMGDFAPTVPTPCDMGTCSISTAWIGSPVRTWTFSYNQPTGVLTVTDFNPASSSGPDVWTMGCGQ